MIIKETIEKIKRQEISVEQLVAHHIDIAKKNEHLNCFITTTYDDAMKRAKESDLRYKYGQNKMLDGIPVGIKDIFCTENILTTAGSKVLSNFYPTYESHVTNLLQNTHGAISLGKLNMDEFAMGSSNETSYFGKVKNPIDNDYTPGGSSGGSAAAVKAGICYASLGTDTGGSIRQPASCVGIVGIKPTYGRCSRYGIISLASSLDQAGVFAHNVEDTQLVLHAISSEYDERDTTSIRCTNSVMDSVRKKDFTVGLPMEILQQTEHGRHLIKFFSKHFKTKEICLKHLDFGLTAYYIILPAEASSNLAQYDGVRYGYRSNEKVNNLEEFYASNRVFGDEVKRRIMLGTKVLSLSCKDSYYVKAQKIRRLITEDFKAAFNDVDFIVTPTTTGPAFKLGALDNDPVSMYLNDLYTIPVNLAGLPAMSIPYFVKNEKLPYGIHLISNYWKESEMFEIAKEIEKIIQRNGVVEGL